MRNGAFNKQTITTLYKRAGEHCTICKKITTRPHRDPEKFHNLGEAAHINGIKNGPNLRYESNLSISQLRSPLNGIWLCKTCHHIIDNDAETYSADYLREIKNRHESLIIKLQESGTTLMPSIIDSDIKIKNFRRLISEQERAIKEDDLIYNQELSQIKVSVSILEKEKAFLNDQLEKIKSHIIDLDDDELQKALLEDGDIPRALQILSEEKIGKSEISIAKSRVLRARLLISNNNIADAARNFEKAFSIWPNFNIAIEYIQFLYFKSLDYRKITTICKEALLNESDSDKKIKLLEQSAQAYLKLGQPDSALANLLEAENSLIHTDKKESDHECHLAIIIKHIGDCYKLTGNLQDAFRSYEKALNLYFHAFRNNNEAGTVQEFAALATAIGLLYEANNDETEGLVHHLRAKEVMKDDKDAKLSRALILINVASCYLKKKTFTPSLAKENLEEAISILTDIAKTDPNECLEYLVGAKCLLGDINIFIAPEKSEYFYLESLKLAKILYDINPVFLHTISHVLHNYAVYLISVKKDYIKGLETLNDSLNKIKNSQLPKIEYISYLSQALFFKVQIVSEKNEKIELLNEIIALTSSLDPSDKSNVFRFSAEKLLLTLTSETLL